MTDPRGQMWAERRWNTEMQKWVTASADMVSVIVAANREATGKDAVLASVIACRTDDECWRIALRARRVLSDPTQKKGK